MHRYEIRFRPAYLHPERRTDNALPQSQSTPRPTAVVPDTNYTPIDLLRLYRLLQRRPLLHKSYVPPTVLPHLRHKQAHPDRPHRRDRHRGRLEHLAAGRTDLHLHACTGLLGPQRPGHLYPQHPPVVYKRRR